MSFFPTMLIGTVLFGTTLSFSILTTEDLRRDILPASATGFVGGPTVRTIDTSVLWRDYVLIGPAHTLAHPQTRWRT
ncbi:MAG: hypothetical protein ACRYFY_05140 [Janthinobacterium lividum]